MKAIGIVRKIDELGRVVIPKEVRREQGWDSGQPLEMFMDDDNQLVMRAYETDEDKKQLVEDLESMTVNGDHEENEILERAIRAIQKGGE
ncbi:AbrB/MazE/SpoVT family DNA-binding domain-containing protein [Salibacterium lacus]|uniref:AbrB/MazE/SpoVT family DNA-binding domain-containing protein n=1 Tax=Salibacterium lacus TaxID=1898109 RepID=A0ABW5T0I8_9BACI